MRKRTVISVAVLAMLNLPVVAAGDARGGRPRKAFVTSDFKTNPCDRQVGERLEKRKSPSTSVRAAAAEALGDKSPAVRREAAWAGSSDNRNRVLRLSQPQPFGEGRVICVSSGPWYTGTPISTISPFQRACGAEEDRRVRGGSQQGPGGAAALPRRHPVRAGRSAGGYGTERVGLAGQ